MHSHNQARKNATRRRHAETGEPYAAALEAVRQGRLNQLDNLTEAAAVSEIGPKDFHNMAVPEALTELVRYHSHRITRYLYFAIDEGRWGDNLAEWQSTTLYKLTDAAEHLHLLIGTIAAYLRDEGVEPYFLRRYLQVAHDRQVEAHFTPQVEEHLAGLTGKPEPDGSVVWHSVGRHIAAQSGWSNPEHHEALEAVLHALYANYPDDRQAFDHLPPDLRDRTLALIPLVRDLDASSSDATS
ncbi:hypothetical protein AB0L33_30420 [Streptomyces sp. NPDC052299]|uniref:hypothetical protein n=1 Tax=Streptomyces sp. NPDC052299 TaxID=3155054 RepID=UPI00343CA59B